LDDQRFDALREAVSKTQKFESSGGFKASGMTPQECVELIQQYSADHVESIAALAKGVQTRAHWHKWHQPQLVTDLSNPVGKELPSPAYPMQGNKSPVVTEQVPGRRYWKISPGPTGKYWDDFREQSLIAMHWSDELVDVSAFDDDQSAFSAQAKSELGVSNQGAKSLWDFSKVMQKG
jgi:hypothetical protein